MNCEELAGLGKITKEVEVLEGLKVKYHTLSVKEEEEVNVSLAQYPQDVMARSGGLQVESLVRAIESIGGKTFTDTKDLREYLMGLQRHVLDLLYNSWVRNLDNESIKKIDELKKNSEPPVPA